MISFIPFHKIHILLYKVKTFSCISGTQSIHSITGMYLLIDIKYHIYGLKRFEQQQISSHPLLLSLNS